MKDAVRDFMRHLKASGRRPSTVRSYSESLGWLLRTLEKKRLRDVRAGDLEREVVALSERVTGGRLRSAATMNRIKSIYRSFFSWCFSTGRIARNPAKELRLARVAPRNVLAITRKEVDCLLTAIRGSGDPRAHRDEALFAVYAFTGIRRSEALPPRIKDYDTSTKRLALPLVKGGGEGSRHVPRRLARILEEYLFERKGQGGFGPHVPLFPGRASTRPLSTKQVQLRFEKWKRAAGLRRELTIHSFRSGFATRLHDVSRSALLVSRALGHRDPRTTVRYIAEDEAALKAALEKAFG